MKTKQLEMEVKMSLDMIHDIDSRQRNTVEMIVIANPSNASLQTLRRHKIMRDGTKLITRKTKQNVMNQDCRRQWRQAKQERLKPQKNTNSKRTLKKKKCRRD